MNTLGINLWGDWEMKQEYTPEVKRGRMEDSDRRGGGRMDLDKLSEMERRMGLGSDRGRERERGNGGGGGGKRDWY